MDSAQLALERLCDPGVEVSAHYLIGETGQVWQMVAEEQRAWHAGGGEWQMNRDVNSSSIGIELANTAEQPFSEPQMSALEDLVSGLMARWDIPAAGVIGHSDMAPGRKIDPGRRFDWRRLAHQGLAAEVKPVAMPRSVDPEYFRHLAKQVGYTSDVPIVTLLEAVRLRLRPQASGPLQAEDIQALTGLL